MESRKTNRRKIKSYLVMPKLQFKFIALSGGTALIVGLTFFGIANLFINENYEILVKLTPMTDQARTLLQSELRQLWTILSLSLTIFVLASSLIALFFSHKIAGPIYNIINQLATFVDSPSEKRIILRPNDELQVLAASVNKVLDMIELSRSQENK